MADLLGFEGVSCSRHLVVMGFRPEPDAAERGAKAAIHAYSESMRYQPRHTPVEVLELAPPYVQTDLMGGAEDPRERHGARRAAVRLEEMES